VRQRVHADWEYAPDALAHATLRVSVLAHCSDQEFSSDMNSRPVKRIEDVRLLRARQFAEDSSPMAHPIRPCSVEKIDNVRTRGHAAPHGVCI
jgi:hypothetical protein